MEVDVEKKTVMETENASKAKTRSKLEKKGEQWVKRRGVR